MRKISFRVWDTKYKKWLEDREYSLENNNHLTLYNCVAEFVDTFYCGADDSRFIIQQFTGVKDANGVDIYEGDIIEWEKYSREGKIYLKYRESVTFHHGVFWIDYLQLYAVDEACKIVGNIFENKCEVIGLIKLTSEEN